MNIKNIVKTFENNKSGSTFVSIEGYKSNKGTVKDYTISFNSDYKKTIERSVVELFKFEPSSDEEKSAKEEILQSLKNSFDSVEERLVDGKRVKGLFKDKCGKLFITGLVIKQDMEPKTVKQKIYAKLPVSRFRQFEISPEKMKSIAINGKKIKVA